LKAAKVKKAAEKKEMKAKKAAEMKAKKAVEKKDMKVKEEEDERGTATATATASSSAERPMEAMSGGDVTVRVETMSASGVWTFRVKPTDSILKLKQMLADDSCWRVPKMTFWFAGEALMDDRECKEFEDKTLHMSVVEEPRETHTPPSPPEVFMLECYYKTADTPLNLVTVAALATDTIRSVKGKIAEAAGISADNMTVWLDRERLGDNRRLYEYDVVDDSDFVIVTY
jgi:hypothetical protein